MAANDRWRGGGSGRCSPRIRGGTASSGRMRCSTGSYGAFGMALDALVEPGQPRTIRR